MKFCKICGTPIVNTQTSSSLSDNKKKTNNTIIKIVSLVVVFAILICGLPSVIFAVKNSKETKGENITYVSEVLIIKNHVDFKVLDEEKFPVDEYEVKVEQYVIGGVLKAISAKNEIFTETSSETTYTLDLDDGDYRITFIETVEVETQSETTEKVDPLTVVMDVKVDNDNENAIDTVDFILLPTEEIEKNKDDKSESSSEFIEASDEDFDKFMNYISAVGTQNFDYQTATTKDVIEGHITQFLNFQGYFYFFEKDMNSENSMEIYDKYYNKGPDPQEKFQHNYDNQIYYQDYYKFPVDNVKWICEKIYNVEFNGNYTSEHTYTDENYLYKVDPAAGDGCWTEYEMVKHTLNNEKYEIIVDTYDCSYGEYDTYRTLSATKKITAEIKIIDGEKYWSIYKIEDYNPNS